MQAKELKLGNYCYCQDEINVIYGITKEGFVQYEKDNNVYYCGIDELKPIELTEEILLKCGFDVNIDIYYLPKMNGYFKKPFKEAEHFLYKSNSSDKLSSVKHLHQLQNLYYALTGEELEINL